MTVYKKLVRDGVPEVIRANGQKASTRVLSKEEYHKALTQKLLEECEEFRTAQTVEELADCLEVVYTLAEQYGGVEALEKARREKVEQRGAFKKRIFLESVEG